MYDVRVSSMLAFLGMNNKIKGYKYSRSAIDEAVNGNKEMRSIYECVAKKYSTSPSCVERNIRYAVENTWEKGNVENIYSLFGYTVRMDKGKPTNGEFVFMLADKILTGTDITL